MDHRQLQAQFRQEAYSSSLPPDFYVMQRIKALFAELQEASKNGNKAERDEIAQRTALYINIKKSMPTKPWVNL